MDRLIHPILISLFCFAFLTVKAQDYSFPFDKSQFQEIATLYVNANRFIPGERILFQIENNLIGGGPSFVSKIAYIELVDASHQSVLKLKIKLEQGRGNGYLYIPSFIKTGQYTLIAYTSWMLNYSKSFIAQYGVQIINPFNPIPTTLLSDSMSITFFPEGGAYVFNQPMRVAYRLSWKRKSIPLNIKIIAPSGEEVSSFIHNHSSPYGHFSFTPIQSDNYKVIISDQDENIYYDQFVVEKSSPLGFSLIENEGNYQVSAINHSGSPKNLILLSWQNLRYKKSFSINSDTTFSINTNDWPKGLAYLNYEGTAIGRFVSMGGVEATNSLSLDTNKDQYNTRELVNLQLPLSNDLNEFSISVRRVYDSVYGNPYSSDLLHQLINEKFETQQLQSDFLICNGIPLSPTESESIVALPDFRGQLLYGQLQDDSSSNRGDVVFLSSIGQAPMLRTAKVQDEGHVLLLSPDSFKGENLVAFSGSNKSVSISESFLDDLSFVRQSFHFDRTDLLPWLQEKAIHVQIENNYFEFYKDSLLDTAPLNWLTKRIDKTYDFDDYTRFPTVTDVIVEIVPELRLRERSGRLELIMPYMESKSAAIDSALILVDGIPIVTTEFVKLNPLQFKKVDLIFQQLRIGFTEYRGLAVFTSLSKDAAMLIERRGYSKVSLIPLQEKVIYYQPNYNNGTSTIPDYKSQLLWKSNLDYVADEAITFYTSDLTGKFEIVMQGKDKEGSYVLLKGYFNVSK